MGAAGVREILQRYSTDGTHYPFCYSVKSTIHRNLNLPAHTPVMVLPNAVLFPNALLPLYIFEPRYRAMLEYSLSQHRMFCLALMKPGITEARTPDDIYEVAGVGMVRACVQREDGNSHLVLQGMARVRLRNFVQEHPFRIAEIQGLRSISAGRAKTGALAEMVLEHCARLQAAGYGKNDEEDHRFEEIGDPGVLCDVVAHTFLEHPEHRQDVLEALEIRTRLETLLHYLEEEGTE